MWRGFTATELLLTGLSPPILVRGLKAHESKTRPLLFCGSQNPEEGECGLHTAQFWTPDNPSCRESRKVCTTYTSAGKS